jgi:hypothetical protein
MEEAELGQAAGRAAVQPEAPEWLRQSQLDWFPAELIDMYGRTLYRMRLDGDALQDDVLDLMPPPAGVLHAR